MQQYGHLADSATAIAQYFEKAALPTQQETLGQVVVEILSDGRNLNRKSLCTKLLSRLEKANGLGRGTSLSHASWPALRTLMS